MNKYKLTLLSLVACGLLVLVFAFLHKPILNLCCSQQYASFVSPNKAYSVIVYSRPQFFALPGSAGDASGYVELVDKHNRVIARKETAMVQNIGNVEWSDHQVHIKLFATWALPSGSQ